MVTPGVPKSKNSYLIFRYDDYHSYSNPEPENAILQIFSKNKAKCVFGVIPFVCKSNWQNREPQETCALTEEKIEFLRNAISHNSIEVALHGFSHQNLYKEKSILRLIFGRKKHSRLSEFYKQSYDDQLKKIVEGKNYLESLLKNDITTFIPPWDEYDKNTLKALERSGFRVISAEGRSAFSARSPLHFLHANSTLRNLRSILDNGPERFFKNRLLTVVESHAFDFKEVGDKKGRAVVSYEEFDKIITCINKETNVRIIDFKTTADIF
jgi:peptidoglycan/xylan/chitin deacetylase (PgdA/CDA1 family)